MQHDIYTLGVSLLEIGPWTSFVKYNDNGAARPSSPTAVADCLKIRGDACKAKAFKDSFSSLADEQLPSKMGWVYVDVILANLTCLDEDVDTIFTKSIFERDDEGFDIGAAFPEAVLTPLRNICAEIMNDSSEEC